MQTSGACDHIAKLIDLEKSRISKRTSGNDIPFFAAWDSMIFQVLLEVYR